MERKWRRVSLLAVAVSVAGCGGTGDVCSVATDHLKACTGLDWATPESCDAEKAQIADRILSKECSKLQELQERRPSWVHEYCYLADGSCLNEHWLPAYSAPWGVDREGWLWHHPNVIHPSGLPWW
jgi:hypothetical protein